MSILSKLRASCATPVRFLRVFFHKITHHKEKFSYFKTLIFVLAIGYLCMQPLAIIRSALASSFVGYMLNNFTNTVLDSAVEVV